MRTWRCTGVGRRCDKPEVVGHDHEARGSKPPFKLQGLTALRSQPSAAQLRSGLGGPHRAPFCPRSVPVARPSSRSVYASPVTCVPARTAAFFGRGRDHETRRVAAIRTSGLRQHPVPACASWELAHTVRSRVFPAALALAIMQLAARRVPRRICERTPHSGCRVSSWLRRW